MTTTDPHAALAHACPFCGAQPGQLCRTRTSGVDQKFPHIRRIAIVENYVRRPAGTHEALCCECGQLRTVSTGYHFAINDENKPSVGHFSDPRGWRATGTLKCAACGHRTRHALLREDDPRFRDYDERTQAYALGRDWPGEYPPDRDRLRAKYFAQFPRNPMLRHRFYVERADKLRAEGKTHMQAACGATCEIPQSWDTADISRDELSEPARIDWDTEVEDNDTGMWWLDMDCVDCLRVANTLQLKRLRKLLLTDLLEMSNAVDSLDAVQVGELREHLARLMDAARTT